MLTYFEICVAAIERYRLEKPVRDLYADCVSKKVLKKFGRKPPIGRVLDYLTNRSLMLADDKKLIEARYSYLSKILHGDFA